MWMRFMRIGAVLAVTCQVAAAGYVGSIHVGQWNGGAVTERAARSSFARQQRLSKAVMS
jgi:hypothetical protein